MSFGGRAMAGWVRRCGFAAALLLGCVRCFAQAGDPGSHRLVVEDVVRISVFNQQQIVAEVPVGRDGRVTAPFVGTAPAEGLTVDELQTELTELYVKKLRLRDPLVSVTLTRVRLARATIGGVVKNPQSVYFRKGDTILTLLNQGGGAIQDQSDLHHAFLRHSYTKEVIPIDLYAMTVLGDTSQNYSLRDGDELIVPRQRNDRVVILGALQNPGQYPYHEPMYLGDAIALAGGELRFRSMFSRTLIFRSKPGSPGQYLLIHADFVKFVREGARNQNVLLQPGDFIFVPEIDSPDIQRLGSLIGISETANSIANGALFNHIFSY